MVSVGYKNVFVNFFFVFKCPLVARKYDPLVSLPTVSRRSLWLVEYLGLTHDPSSTLLFPNQDAPLTVMSDMNTHSQTAAFPKESLRRMI